MGEKLKKVWDYVRTIVTLVVIAAAGVLSAIAISGKIPGRFGKTVGSGVSGGDNGSQRLATGLGQLVENQQQSSDNLKRAADDNRKLADGQQAASGIIDSAKTRVDKLDSLLGIPKDSDNNPGNH